jgi:thiosulfate/3-mercaptopyruvate sulfurtransferase
MSPLLTVEWLAERLRDPEVVMLDATLPPVGVVPKVDTRARYAAEHIPGAVFFDIDELSDHATSLPHMLPPEAEFARAMSALGVSSEASIVVYEQEGVFSAPRAWWMLRVFGAKDVRVLDGGLRAWVDARLPVESGTVRREAARFDAKLDHDAVEDFAGIQRKIAGRGQTRGQIPAQILDARSAGRFAGTAPEPRPGISSGHMPGAVSLPFTELSADGRMKNAEALREIFASKGVNIARPVTTTCGSGVTAAVLALGLEMAGARQVQLYDGSWAEYAQRAGSVIIKDSH